MTHDNEVRRYVSLVVMRATVSVMMNMTNTEMHKAAATLQHRIFSLACSASSRAASTT